MNILSADVFLWADGTSVYVFRVSDPPDALYPEELWSRVDGAVRSALLGKLSLEYRLARKRESLLACRRGGTPGGPGAASVRVENEASDLFTLARSSLDRIGLFKTFQGLAELRLEVHLAKVDSMGDSPDVFYVRGATARRSRTRTRPG